MVEAEKERHRVPVLGGVVEDPVHRRLETVVGKPLKEVANVDDEGVGDRRHLDPLTILCKDLQPTNAVLPEQGEALKVGVCSETDVDDGVLRFSVFRVVVDNTVTVQSVSLVRFEMLSKGL